MPEQTGPRPHIPYWHLWRGQDGVSRQARCELTAYELQSIGDAAPQWNDKQARGRGDGRVHRAAGRLGGRVAREPGAAMDHRRCPAAGGSKSMDGTRIEQGPGEFSLGEDQGCATDADGRKGHRSGTIGNEPAVLMTVQLHRAPVRAPCHV